MRSRIAAFAAALIALAAALAGCGSSHHSTTTGTTTPPGPQFQPTGAGPLAQGAIPRGERFTIGSENYELGGHTYLELTIATRTSHGEGFTPAQAHGPFAFGNFGECTNPKALLIYGVLRVATDEVTVLGAGTHQALTVAPIPARLGAGGTLLYGVVRTPARVTVTSRSGAALESARLTGASRQVCPTKAGTFSTLAVVHVKG